MRCIVSGYIKSPIKSALFECTVGLRASRYGPDFESFLFYRHKPDRTLPVDALRQTRALPVHINTTVFATAVSPVWSAVTNSWLPVHINTTVFATAVSPVWSAVAKSWIPCKRRLAVHSKVKIPFFTPRACHEGIQTLLILNLDIRWRWGANFTLQPL